MVYQAETRYNLINMLEMILTLSLSLSLVEDVSLAPLCWLATCVEIKEQ